MGNSSENASELVKKAEKMVYRRSPNLDNLKSNTMKNTVQKYEIYLFLVYRKQKIYILAVIFYLF